MYRKNIVYPVITAGRESRAVQRRFPDCSWDNRTRCSPTQIRPAGYETLHDSPGGGYEHYQPVLQKTRAG